MATRIVSARGGAVLVAALMISTSTALAQNNTNRSQQVFLPDPTPRPIDPRLLLGDNSQAGTSTQSALENRNAKRRQLVEWAANELVTLSQHLELDVAKSKTGDSMTTEAANAEKIEQLARNLTTALKAP